VWEVRFHPTHPSHLFTCSNDGSVWHWDSSDIAAFSLAATGGLFANTPSAAKGLLVHAVVAVIPDGAKNVSNFA